MPKGQTSRPMTRAQKSLGKAGSEFSEIKEVIRKTNKSAADRDIQNSKEYRQAGGRTGKLKSK